MTRVTTATGATPLLHTMNTIGGGRLVAKASRHGGVTVKPRRGGGVDVVALTSSSSSSFNNNRTKFRRQHFVRGGADGASSSSSSSSSSFPLPSSSKLRRRSAAKPRPISAVLDNANTRGGSSASRFRPVAKKANRWQRVSQLMMEEATADLWGAYRINTYATAQRYSLSELASRIRMSEVGGGGTGGGGERGKGGRIRAREHWSARESRGNSSTHTHAHTHTHTGFLSTNARFF